MTCNPLSSLNSVTVATAGLAFRVSMVAVNIARTKVREKSRVERQRPDCSMARFPDHGGSRLPPSLEDPRTQWEALEQADRTLLVVRPGKSNDNRLMSFRRAAQPALKGRMGGRSRACRLHREGLHGPGLHGDRSQRHRSRGRSSARLLGTRNAHLFLVFVDFGAAE